MKKILTITTFCLTALITHAQRKAYDRLDLFEKEDPIPVTLKMDTRDIMNKKANDRYLCTSVAIKSGDSVLQGEINVRARGKFRREFCFVPPLKLDFDTSTAGSLKGLKSIDITCQCKMGNEFSQLVYKEYTTYRLYNIITDRSQRVRLVNLTLEDKEGKRKPVTIPGFFIEDFDVTAKRNAAKEVKISKLHTENTDRRQMTMVALFEYMVGNTDWSVYANHNIKLMQDTANAGIKPYASAYDFDFSGLVNAPYATPDPQLGTETVTTRVYRGFPREVAELKEMADYFRSKKEAMYAEINNSKFLDNRSKKDMIGYLDEFFREIQNERNLKVLFIDNARQM
jgi:hypothetical protein